MGRRRDDALLALVRTHGARLLGPNCLGISSTAVGLNATFASRAPVPGNIGFSSQSGALGLALLEASVSRGLGLSAFVSIGNKADISSNDLLEWWEDDDSTALVLLYVVSPVDFVPDFIPFLGVMDDVVLVPLAIRWLLDRLPAQMQQDVGRMRR